MLWYKVIGAGGVGGDTAWNISTANYVQSFSVVAQSFWPRDVVFKPDGTKMYVSDADVSSVFEYDLSTAWDVSTASYVQDFSVSSEDSRADGIFFKPDGTKMYVTGWGRGYVYEYNLSTAWDVSTASYVQDFSVLSTANRPRGISFKPDGTKMYVMGNSFDVLSEYNLSSAWNISTASYVQDFIVSSQALNPEDVFFKPDGTKMYVTDSYNDRVVEYNLSTSWDVSTASYVQDLFVGDKDNTPSGIYFKPDGTRMYMTGVGSDSVHEYHLFS